jgi:hypothetical protein
MQSAREQALHAVKSGDVIFGLGAGGQEKLLLVYDVGKHSILARHVTTQMELKFDRDGKTGPVPGGGHCTIVSIAALPADQHEVAVGLDRKMRTGKDYPDFVLSKAEIQLILTYGAFFRAHPLPE